VLGGRRSGRVKTGAEMSLIPIAPLLMNTRALLTALVLGLAASAAQATVLIYEGPVKTVSTGSAAKQTASVRTYIVFDLMTASAKRIEYFRVGKSKVKTYRVSEAENFSSHLVTGPKDTTYKDIIAAETNQPTVDEFVTHTFFLKGTATQREYRTGVKRPLPRVLTGTQKDVHVVLGVNRLVEQTFALSYQSALTIQSNEAGASLSAAVTKVTDLLTAKGYQVEQQ